MLGYADFILQWNCRHCNCSLKKKISLKGVNCLEYFKWSFLKFFPRRISRGSWRIVIIVCNLWVDRLLQVAYNKLCKKNWCKTIAFIFEVEIWESVALRYSQISFYSTICNYSHCYSLFDEDFFAYTCSFIFLHQR